MTIPVSTQLGFYETLEANLYNTHTLFLNGEVTEYQAEMLTTQFQILGEETEEITLLITSYGGAVEAGGAVIRAIRYARSKGCSIIGEVRGYAMSMAAVILQECDVRIASKDDIIMVHGAHGMSIGDIRNQEADLKLTKRLMDTHAKLYSERNTSEKGEYQKYEYWRNFLDDQLPHYFFGDEALECGLIDDLIES